MSQSEHPIADLVANIVGMVVFFVWVALFVLYYSILFKSVAFAEELGRPNDIAFWLVTGLFALSHFVQEDPNVPEGTLSRRPGILALLGVLYLVSPLVLVSYSLIALFSALVSVPLLVAAIAGYIVLRFMAPDPETKTIAPWALVLLQALLFVLPIAGSLSLWQFFREPRLGPLGLEELLSDPKGNYYLFGFAATYSMIWMCVGVHGKIFSIRFDADVKTVARAMSVSALALGLFAQVVAWPGGTLRAKAYGDYRRGQSELARGDVQAAEASFRAALESWPTSPAATEGLVETSLRRGKLREARGWLERTHDLIKVDTIPGFPYREQHEVRIRLESFLKENPLP